MSGHRLSNYELSNNKMSSKFRKRGKLSLPTTANHGSDSNQSEETNSISGESQEAARSPNTTHKPSRKKGEWEILESLKEGQRFEYVPHKFEGYLLKRRKWPLKGWHKRYFVLDSSILTYSKNAADLAKGKKHGSMDISMSVISTKAMRRRIDIDADANIYHLKCKSREVYLQWIEQLNQHRLYKQHQMLYNKAMPNAVQSPHSGSDDSPTDAPTCKQLPSSLPSSLPGSLNGTLNRDCKPFAGAAAAGAGTLRSWVVDRSIVDQLARERELCQQNLSQLIRLVDIIEHQDDASHGEPATPSTKTRRKFRLRKHKSNKSTGSAEVMQDKSMKLFTDSTDGAPPSLCTNCANSLCRMDSLTIPHQCPEISLLSQVDEANNLKETRPLSNSNPALSNQANPWQPVNLSPTSRPHSYSESVPNANGLPLPQSPHSPSSSQPVLPRAKPPAITLDTRFAASTDSTTSSNSTREDFTILAKDVINQINQMLKGIQMEREKMRQAFENESNFLATHNATSIINTLRTSLNQTVQQNAELRGRLARIHADSDLSEISVPISMSELLHRSLHTSLSYESSSCFSASEYFDANDAVSDVANSDTTSEASSDNSSCTSEASDAGTDAHPSATEIEEESKCLTGRRTRLPITKPPTEDFSIFNFLYKNIGKDLSKVCMPISLNEPLNMLQRLCEELEYSELLDKAAGIEDPAQRMIQVAAFAVSAYASSIYRCAHKPFNPLLGETYEAIREDKGFRFIAEQVSHHPPVSACHAQSNNFILWQQVRIKTKFWGRSLEFQPSGSVHVVLPKWDDHYEWNKVTSCVHNLFGRGNRWVDQYGEMTITNKPQNLTCKLSFAKASSWSSKRHEVFGSVLDADGRTIHNLFGKWTEALYCGHAPSAKVVWRPGSMPEDYDVYYGFTRFAMELNELDKDLAKVLPPTDTRFRPDQRMLEEGNLADSEQNKTRIEQKQRERRKLREENGISYVPMWFRHEVIKGGEGEDEEDNWVFSGEYWNKRRDPGFANMSFEQLW